MGKVVWASTCESKINPRHVCIVRVTVVELQVVRRLLSDTQRYKSVKNNVAILLKTAPLQGMVDYVM